MKGTILVTIISAVFVCLLPTSGCEENASEDDRDAGIGDTGGTGNSSGTNETLPAGFSRLEHSGSREFVNGATIGSDGALYITGMTDGHLAKSDSPLGSPDVFVSKLVPSTTGWNESVIAQLSSAGGPSDVGRAIAAFSDGDLAIVGQTYGDMGAIIDPSFNPAMGAAFATRITTGGKTVWSTVWGTDEEDYPYGACTDSEGAVYVVGRTAGKFGGQPNLGEEDAFITKLSATGNLEWTKQFGGGAYDEAMGVATDSEGFVYVAGKSLVTVDGDWVHGMIWLKLDPTDGSTVWSKQRSSQGVAADNAGYSITISEKDEMFMAGVCDGEVCVIKIDTSTGNPSWSSQWHYDEVAHPRAIAATAAGVFVSGVANAYSMITLEGSDDVFMAKVSPDSGDLIYEKRWKTSNASWSYGLAVTQNAVYAVGTTKGNIEEDGATTLSDEDGFVIGISATSDSL